MQQRSQEGRYKQKSQVPSLRLSTSSNNGVIMSALDDYSIDELRRLEKKYEDDTTGFLRQVKCAIKGKELNEARR